MEWEQTYEADSGELALELAKLEANSTGEIVDELARVEEVLPATKVD